jgi:hypothetical protein
MPFEVGQKVEARDPYTGNWRPALLTKDPPYWSRGRLSHGFYLRWMDTQPTREDPFPSQGGWMSINCIRPLDK